MNSNKTRYAIAGWLVFLITGFVYYLSAERTGSLWDCGEFITGAYKLQVVHPPGAPLFVLIGRLFTIIPQYAFPDNPEYIAFAVNLMSGISTALAATFVCWVTIMLGKLAMVGRDGTADTAQSLALSGAGLVSGLTTAFCTSVWFSAVEGEVYAMSTMFTAMTLWAAIKWYSLPDEPKSDRWLVFAIYAAGLSIGVHLLSILTFPALALFYYFKKWEKPTFLGMGVAAIAGVVTIAIIQNLVIVGIPSLWARMELITVNGMGLPVHSGLLPTFLITVGLLAGGLYYAARIKNATLQKAIVALAMVIMGFSTIGVVVIRANANTPINMNAPSDAMRLLPYINREQYGERELLFGPDFDADIKRDQSGFPVVKRQDKYGLVDGEYVVVDEKIEYEYEGTHFFPRMQDYSQSRPQLYQMWMQSWGSNRKSPNFIDNVRFALKYQVGWMYWRYFMWNFAGRQNAEQGYFSWDITQGNWASGLNPLDEARLHNMSELTEDMATDQGRNRYYMLPFLFGLIGLIFHFRKNRNDALGILALFIITGIGIIIYSNQPPNEPRERDYVLAGSFFTYSIWIGMAVLALFALFKNRIKISGAVGAIVSTLLILVAPFLMGTQNFDDHSRAEHSGARDYASNFLNSVEENAIIFTYGDNDTYPLWYAQEVEGIRRDVRVVNLSLIAVDWYISQLRRKINDSPAIEMTIPEDAYRGKKRVQTLYYNRRQGEGYDASKDQLMSLKQLIQFIGEDHPLPLQGGRTTESYYPTRRVFIPVNKQEVLNNGTVGIKDTAKIVNRIEFNLGKNSLIKDDLAILDIISSNAFKRPIYFAVTCQPAKMQGLRDYMQLEGLALRIIPVKSKTDNQYPVIGSGRVNVDKVYENVMNEDPNDGRDGFRWGGFDKKDLFVDNSYMPSVQSHKLMFLRTAEALIQAGDKERAIKFVDKYFEGFPHFNFPYDYLTILILDNYIKAGAYDKAKPHLEILAKATKEKLDFFASLSTDELTGAGSFEQDYESTKNAMNALLATVNTAKDEAYLKELLDLFSAYQEQNLERFNNSQ